MRLAGTIRRYSASAMPQLASAAIHQGFADSSFRCAYHAKVMNTFEANSRPAEVAMGESCISVNPFCFLVPASGKQGAGLAPAGDGGLRRDLGQRPQHERALVHARMGHGKSWRGQSAVAIQQKV